jgi:hypothetical protein
MISVIGEWTFAECSLLQSVCIPSSIEAISCGCFAACSSVSYLGFDPGCRVSTLGESAFSSCMSLESICIPSSMETSSTFCFCRCEKLTKLTFDLLVPRFQLLATLLFNVVRHLNRFGYLHRLRQLRSRASEIAGSWRGWFSNLGANFQTQSCLH